MSEVEMTLWNVVLTILVAVIGWIMNEKFKCLNDVAKLLNRTREEFARDHITRQEVREDMQQILIRFDKLENKLDQVLKGSDNASRDR